MSEGRKRTPKSMRTRQSIETAARELFAINGFERTTVREIGARAGIDPAMVIRYFGSKDALFTRVAEPDLLLPDLTQVESARIGETLVRHFLKQWEDESGGGMAVLLRSAASNEGAAQRLREIFRVQIFPAIARAGPAHSAPERAGLVASQLLGLALSRYVLKIPPVVAMPRDRIVSALGATIQRHATGRAD